MSRGPVFLSLSKMVGQTEAEACGQKPGQSWRGHHFLLRAGPEAADLGLPSSDGLRSGSSMLGRQVSILRAILQLRELRLTGSHFFSVLESVSDGARFRARSAVPPQLSLLLGAGGVRPGPVCSLRHRAV